MITLNKAIHVPLIKAAFEAKALQMFNREHAKETHTCRYNGPCAIGVVLPEEARIRFDNLYGKAIGNLIHDKVVTTDDDDWWKTLQYRHDMAVDAYHSWLNSHFMQTELDYRAAVERFRVHLYGGVAS